MINLYEAILLGFAIIVVALMCGRNERAARFATISGAIVLSFFMCLCMLVVFTPYIKMWISLNW